jgi:signal transduction histidine kinase
MTSFLFGDLIDEVIENFRMTEGFDRITFRREFNKSLRVVSDRVRLLMILNNLVANAIKYHNFSQAEPWVKVDASIASQHLLITVSDNGQGIEPYVLPKIFNMFYRGTNQSAGSGLGLYIVREAVEKLDGSITAESEPGSGTTFRISLPHS